MRITKIFAIALTSLMLVSCTKKNHEGEDNPGGDQVGSPTYATFKFNVGGTKAAADFDPTAIAEQDVEDAKLGKIQLLIFNSTSGALEFNEVIESGAISKTILLTAGKKKIFFLANTDNLDVYNTAIDPATFKVGATGTSLVDFNAMAFSAGAAQNNADLAGARTFDFSKLYTLSKVGVSGLPMSNTNEITYTLKDGIDEATASGSANPSSTGVSVDNAFKVQLYFLVAKARLKVAAGVLNDGTTGKAVVSDVKYSIRNLAKMTSYVQNVPTAGNPQSYYFNYNKTAQADFDTDFDRASNIMIDAKEIAGNYLYVPENNNQMLLRGQSSYFAIKANYEPVVVITASYDLNTTVKYTKEKLGTADAANKNYIYTVNDVEGIAAGSYFVTKELFAQAAWIMKNKKAFVEADHRTEANALIAAADYLSFRGAQSYYRIDIGSGSGSGTQYGVLRSNRYEAVINNISGPGVPSEDDLANDPEKPVSSKTNVSATVVAAQWKAVNQSADL